MNDDKLETCGLDSVSLATRCYIRITVDRYESWWQQVEVTIGWASNPSSAVGRFSEQSSYRIYVHITHSLPCQYAYYICEGYRSRQYTYVMVKPLVAFTQYPFGQPHAHNVSLPPSHLFLTTQTFNKMCIFDVMLLVNIGGTSVNNTSIRLWWWTICVLCDCSLSISVIV